MIRSALTSERWTLWQTQSYCRSRVCCTNICTGTLINQHCQRCHESIPRTIGDSLEINICLTSDARLRDKRKNTAERHRTARIKHQCWITTYATFPWAVFTWLNLHVNISSLHCNCIPSFTCKRKQNVKWWVSSPTSDQEEIHLHWQENRDTYAAHFMDSVSTNKNTQTLIQMQETTTMFQAAHEFNDIGRTSDSCWFSPSIRDFPLHQHICIQLQNKKKRIKRTQWLQLHCTFFPPAFAMKIQISPCGNTFHLYCKHSDWQKSAFLTKTGWEIWIDRS